MAIIAFRQTKIWQELERELPPGLEEVRDFLCVLSEFDQELVRELRLERRNGRDDHPVAAMWNLVSIGLYLRNGKFSELLAELKRNSDLARLLGFEEVGPNEFDTPSKSAFSRFHVKLKSEKYLERVQAVFERSVEALASENPEFGKHSTLDASDVRTHARPGTKNSQNEGGNEGKAEETQTKEGRPSSDPDASWSVKSKDEGKGKKSKKTKATFGYKLYAVSDSTIPAICAVDVQTGKTSDYKMAIPMIEAAQKNLGADRIETTAMDKGFDSEENVLEAFERGVSTIVPVRDVPENLEKLVKEDREEPLSPGQNVVYDRYTGEVFCYAAPANTNAEPQRRQMDYAGFEKDRKTHKFRCPLGACARSSCASFDTCAAGSGGSQGKQVRIPMKLDARRFAPVYPRSKRWKRLYNGRSAVERVNAYLKDVLPLERHALRGKNAIKLRVLIASLTLNLRTLVSLRRQRALSNAA